MFASACRGAKLSSAWLNGSALSMQGEGTNLYHLNAVNHQAEREPIRAMFALGSSACRFFAGRGGRLALSVWPLGPVLFPQVAGLA